MYKIFGIIILASYSHALTIGFFNNIATGVQDAWNQSNPENTRGGRFVAEVGNSKLWLISRRLHRPDLKNPWDSAARGGIVSTLHLSNKTWTHKSYDRLDDDTKGDKVFSLNGVLFLLTYSTNQNKIGYHKLFFWNDDQGEWLTAPFEVDPAASTTGTNSIQALTVSVPKHDGKVAYVVASVHGQATAGGQQAYAKLEVEFRGPVPTKASLKSLTHENSQKPSAVFFTAVKNNKLYAFLQHFFSEGYVSEYGYANVLDLTTNRVSNVSLLGPAPEVQYNEEGIHQTDNEVLIVGGTQVYGLGQLRNIDDIFVLNLSSFQWQKTPFKILRGAGKVSVYDQRGKKLYLIGLSEGVKAADVSD